MGTFLFFILKSSVCLFLFTILYITLLKNITHFRFSRWAFWVGTLLCWLIPLIPVSVSILSPIQQSVMMVGEIFEEIPSDGKVATGFLTENGWDARAEHLPFQQGKSEGIYGLSLLTVISLFYTMGAVGVFLFFVYSFGRLWHLIHGKPVQREGSFRLVILPGKVCSFSWWKYIVMSEEDYRQDGSLILIHEKMHLSYYHTLDLGWMHCLLIFHWFNPMTWVLWQELRDLHEYEADEGVISSGVNMVQYQLLLVKKAVGTRLYSMANGFNHSKLKKRITMMLKERTNRWARLKLLFVVPVMGGALYAFAQPEVKEDLGLNTVREVLQSKTGEDQDIFKFVDDEMEAYYNRSPKNAELKYKIRERQAHIVKVDANGQLTLNNKTIAKEDLKEVLKKTMVEHKRLAKEKYNSAEDQVGGVLFSPDTPKEQVKDLLSVMRDAFVEIRADIAQTSGNNSKEYLDKEFPILIGYGDISIKDRKKNPYNNSTTMKITGIHLKLLSAAGKVEKEITNFTLAELERDLKDFCTLQGDKKNEITVSMKVDKGCEMGIVTDVKTVLRNNYLLKLNYQ